MYPAVERESILSIDMAFRLEELGFSQVRRMRWFDDVKIGAARLVALPFYGEQPTSGRRYHPEVRNVGNIYMIEAGSKRVAFIADSGALMRRQSAHLWPYGSYRCSHEDDADLLLRGGGRYCGPP